MCSTPLSNWNPNYYPGTHIRRTVPDYITIDDDEYEPTTNEMKPSIGTNLSAAQNQLNTTNQQNKIFSSSICFHSNSTMHATKCEKCKHQKQKCKQTTNKQKQNTKENMNLFFVSLDYFVFICFFLFLLFVLKVSLI
jgi:hypothetical protein